MDNEKPDKYIEEFWLYYKKSMINFYKLNSFKSRPIDKWSDILNNLQNKKKYKEIEKHILNYMSLYAIDLLRSCDNYHMNILITNIKRWKKLSKHFNEFTDNENYYNIIFLLVDIYKGIMFDDDTEIDTIFSQLELIVIYKDFSNIINYAIKYNKPSILTKINKYCDISNYFLSNYGIQINSKNSFRKVLLSLKQ